MKTLHIIISGLLCQLVHSIPLRVNQLNVETSCEIEGGDGIADLACQNAVYLLPVSNARV